MSEEKKNTSVKDTGVKDVKVENKETTKVEEGFKYGTTPYLTLTLLKGKNAFHFQMPIGTHLDACVEGAAENLRMVTHFRDSAKKKEEEAIVEKAKAEKKEKDSKK